MHERGDWELIAATLMPDHIHLLFTLGERLAVGQVVGKCKAMTRDMGRTSWHWQQDGFEHRLRLTDSIEDYALYIFMNPYRAGLCDLKDRWPWWVCPRPNHLRFLGAIGANESVPKAWLGLSEEIAGRIFHGE